MSCIFCQVVQKKIKSSIIYEDKNVIVFPDISPRAKYHVLIVSKKHVTDFSDAEVQLLKEIVVVAQKLIYKEKLKEKGFRLVVNGGGAQIIDHLHVHLMGGINKERVI